MDPESSRVKEEEKSKVDVLDPEYLLDSIGSWNKYQFFQNVYFIIIVIFFTYSHYLPVLYLYVPEHHCLIPGGEEWNLTQNDLKDIFIPRIKNESQYEKCIQYDVDVVKILESGIRETDTNWPTINCKNGWHYLLDDDFNSVASEFNFVCDDSWKGPLTDTFYFIGSALGLLIYGWIGDHFGRYWTVMIGHWTVCICGIGIGFSSNYLVYTVIRFFMGMSTLPALSTFFVLAMEYVSKTKRGFIGNFSLGLGVLFGGAFMPSLFYALKDWRLVNHVMFSQMLLTFLLPFLINESIRWLLECKKFSKACDILQKVAKFNNKELDKNIILELQNQETSSESDDSASNEVTSIFELFKTPRLRRHILTMIALWSLVVLMFEIYLRIINNINIHVYYSFAISTFLEFPADILIIYAMEYFGRRWTILISLVLSGISALIAAFFDSFGGSALTIMILSMIGKFSNSMGLNVVLQFLYEICPTDLRGRGSSLIQFVGALMSFIAPFIVYSSTISSILPYLFLAIGGCAVGFLALTLPETAGIDLPANAKEGEEFGRSQSFFYMPFIKNKKEKIQMNQIKEK